MIAFLCPAALALPLHAPAYPPAPQGDAGLPEATEILTKYRAALGEASALSAVRNVTMHGKSSWVGLEGSGFVTEVYAGLKKARSKTEFVPFGNFELGADGEVVWEKSPLGVTVRESWNASQYCRLFGFSQHTDWREMYQKATCTGVEELDGARCYVLNMYPRALFGVDGEAAKDVPPPDVWYVDAATFLPRRLDARTVGLFDEPAQMRMELDDWRTVDGIRYPHVVDLVINDFRFSTVYSSFEHNRDLPPGFFDLDDEVREELAKQRDPERASREDEIVVTELEERHFAAIRVTCAHADMQKNLSVILPETLQHVMAAGVAMDGQPLVRYHDWGDPIDMEGGIPVREPVEAGGRVKPSTLPAGTAVVAWHVGPYDRLGDTHERIQAFLEAEGLVRRAAPWEEYWTDPGMEPDPGKWRTKVVWPVKKRGDFEAR